MKLSTLKPILAMMIGITAVSGAAYGAVELLEPQNKVEQYESQNGQALSNSKINENNSNTASKKVDTDASFERIDIQSAPLKEEAFALQTDTKATPIQEENTEKSGEAAIKDKSAQKVQNIKVIQNVEPVRSSPPKAVSPKSSKPNPTYTQKSESRSESKPKAPSKPQPAPKPTQSISKPKPTPTPKPQPKPDIEDNDYVSNDLPEDERISVNGDMSKAPAADGETRDSGVVLYP